MEVRYVGDSEATDLGQKPELSEQVCSNLSRHARLSWMNKGP